MENGVDSPDALPLPSPLAIGATSDEACAYQFGRLTALDAKSRGYNLVFGPIIDIAMNPLSSCVGPRAFGGDPDLVSRMATAAIRGYQDQGMAVTAKHYPGFGESPVDSHIGMVYLDADETALRRRELAPYRAAIQDAGLSGVMVGHIMVPAIDPSLPASLSPRLIGLLRELGFDGIIMTDSLAMVGLTNMYGLPECHAMAMAAGNDLLITSYRIRARQAYEWMIEAWKKGKVTDAQIDTAARRVTVAQARTLKLPEKNRIGPEERDAARSLARRAITARLADSTDSPAIDPSKRHLFFVQHPNQFIDPHSEMAETDAGSDVSMHCEALIRASFPASDIWRINAFPGRAQMERACAASMNYDSVIFIAISRTEHYLGSSDLTRRMLALMEGVAPKTTAIVLFGNPHAARELPAVPRIIFGYDGADCHEAAIETLAGNQTAEGRLPIRL